MVSSLFEAVLKEFTTFFNCDLKPDSNNSCLVKLASGISLQLEMNKEDRLLIGCRLGLLQGKYREIILKEALKANWVYLPSTGTFGYSEKSSQLILFVVVAPDMINAEHIAEFLPPFIAKASTWFQAIKQGETPHVEAEVSRPSSGGPFFNLHR